MATATPNSALLLALLFFIFTLTFSTRGEGVGSPVQGGQGEADLYVPVGPIQHHLVGALLGRSLLGAPYRTCRECRCCPAAGNQTGCLTLQCCYEISCNSPGKLSGVCTFAPTTCNCASCG